MAYTDVAEMATDDDLRRRLYACIATMRVDNGAMWVDRWAWLIVAGDPAWSTAWAQASPDARRGWDSAVITDQMILDRVRAVQEEKGQI